MTQVAAWLPEAYFPPDARSVLDVGCNAGDFLVHAHRDLGFRELYGIDINPDAVQRANARLAQVAGVHIAQGSADQLPFATGCVDLAVCAEVLEHVPSDLRRAVIREVSRVLVPGARWIITVPAAGLFQWLDPTNLRLQLPGVYSVASRVMGGRDRAANYEGQKHGIVWHDHFGVEELGRLLAPEFELEQVRYRGGLLACVIGWLQWPFFRRQLFDNPVLKAMNELLYWDMGKDYGPQLATNLMVVARSTRK
jgi:SAM-dependent methyltransferase